MGYRWRHFNHRIAGWKFGLARNGEGDPWADHLESLALGGPYSNELLRHECPKLKFDYQRVDVDSIRRIGAARRRLHVVLDSDGVYRGRRTFDRDELQLSGYRRIAPVITGFGFDTAIPQSAAYPNAYRPAHGYLTRGIGAGVEVADTTDTSVELSFWLRFGTGAAMDRPHHNEAMLEARLAGELDVALIGVTDVPVHRGGVSYRTEYGEPKIAVGTPIDGIPKRLQRIEIDGTASAPPGIFGVQAFNFDLTPKRSCNWNRNWPLGDDLRGEDGGHPEYGAPGYYIRELTLALRREHFDRETGHGSFLFEGFASNTTFSIPFHPLHCEFSGRMVWIQTDSDQKPVAFTSEFPTGASEFALADME